MSHVVANKDQFDLWNQAGGQTWSELHALLDRVLTPFGDRVLDLAADLPVHDVLDVGCGAGATTLALAERLGPDARVVGMDISAPLVEVARRRAREANQLVEFRRDDAQTAPLETAGFDLIISRFGVMFFDDPVAAFRNLRRAARADARLVFVAWRGPEENPFFTLAQEIASAHVALPAPAPGAPGQFAFRDGDRVRSILSTAGWTDIRVEPVEIGSAVPAEDLDVYVTRLGPLGQIFPGLPDDLRSRVRAAVIAAHRPLVRDGAARFTGACWLVTARA